jgi:tetratricopeptide (TPR) repeat protein
MSFAGVAGETLAHYRLKERLGAGAMGDVWLAEDVRLHRSVALKMLRGEGADADAAARLLREARVASTLNHPNVAVVYDVGEADQEGRRISYIAMEHVPGRTLAAILAEGPLEAAAALRLLRQVAEALADAHEHGIVHRDVKPGNVMVTERGLVKVLDFGLARFAPPGAEDSATWSGRHGPLDGAIAGTLAYMSPEQVRGGVLDARSDIFSLGVLVYEMLAGRRPFGGKNAFALVDAILREPPSPLHLTVPIADALGALALRMLEKDPERRPAGLREVCAELDAIAAGRAPDSAPASAAGEPSVAVVAFANVTGRPDDAWLGTGLAETVAAGLAGLSGVTVISRERIVEVTRALGDAAEPDDGAAVRIGREVGARFVVSGAYQCLGDEIRVTARVTETASGKVTLNAKVDGCRDAIFAVQDRILAELAAGLRGRLPAARRADDTRSLEAYEAFTKGLVNLQAESRESLDRAIAFFERAIALDPDYARAHMYLGAALDVKGDYLGMRTVSEQALASLDRALALRPDSAEAWRYRGSALIPLGRDDEALVAFERALARDPTEASAHAGVGRVHFVLRGEFAAAAAAYERALALNPKAGWSALQLAHCAAYLRDLPRAERAARLAVELQQALLSGQAGLVIVGGHVRLGQAFALQGRHADALAEYERELDYLRSVDHALRGRIFIELQQRIGEAHLRLGHDELGQAALGLAVEAFERRVRTGATDPATPYYAACAYALRGDRAQALACLEAASERRPRLTAARAPLEPALADLRSEARFQQLVTVAGEVPPAAG